MKSILLSLLIIITLTSCNKGDDVPLTVEQFSITGRFLAPNNLDPISNGRIKAYVNSELKAETLTTVDGTFNLSLPAGNYDVVLSKGQFTANLEVTVENNIALANTRVETLPNIAVVTGEYDNIESVLYSIGLFNPITGAPLFDIIDGNSLSRIQATNSNKKHKDHGHLKANAMERNALLQTNVDFGFGDLMQDPSLLAEYDIIFLNCGLTASFENDSSIFSNYVMNGGILYATDWASGYLDAITNSGTNYLTPLTPEKSGVSTTTVATILDGDLSAWLLVNFGISINDTVEIDDFLMSWQVIDSYDSNTTISWLNGPVTYWDETNTEISENKDLAFTFLHGDGAVFYSSFHTENNLIDEFSDVDRIMQFLVFEMSDID